jgi:4-aminobutyrate aminotransferase-like enzyme
VDEPSVPGDDIARLRTAIPGPRSLALAQRLGRVESRNITRIAADGPVFWAEAAGANVRDVDGNLLVDLTAGFGVAHAGHAHPQVVEAIRRQATRLPHALGDVHPADVKLALLERLAAIAPGELSVSILANAGGEAIEAALKTAVLRTGRPGILAFQGAYHGLTYGALAATSRADFRTPFLAQLYRGVRFAPFPAAGGNQEAEREQLALEAIVALLDAAEGSALPIGAILVEPVQGRGGLVVPSATFLSRLRALCDGERRLLIFDEIYTGFGRTGRWFAAEHFGVVPDLMVVGKALSGSLPISAVLGTPAVMAAWPVSTGEAIHTSTFLGNPIACAAAIAQIDAIEAGALVPRAEMLGRHIRTRTQAWLARGGPVRACRGLGLLQGVELAGDAALRVAAAALRRGVLILAEGEKAEVLAITPPAVITERQLDFALDVLDDAIRSVA